MDTETRDGLSDMPRPVSVSRKTQKGQGVTSQQMAQGVSPTIIPGTRLSDVNSTTKREQLRIT